MACLQGDLIHTLTLTQRFTDRSRTVLKPGTSPQFLTIGEVSVRKWRYLYIKLKGEFVAPERLALDIANRGHAESLIDPHAAVIETLPKRRRTVSEQLFAFSKQALQN